MDDSTPSVSSATAAVALSDFPTEIILRIYTLLMDLGGEDGDAVRRARQRNFISFGAVSSLFRAIAKGNGHYFISNSEGLVELLLLLSHDQARAAGVTSLTLHVRGVVDMMITRKVLRCLEAPTSLKQLKLILSTPISEIIVQEEVLLMAELERFKGLEIVYLDRNSTLNNVALCRYVCNSCTSLCADHDNYRCLLQWPMLRSLDLGESSSDDQDFNSGDDHDDYLQRPSPTSLSRLHTLCVDVTSSTRLALVEKILSFRQITHLEVGGDGLDGDPADRLQAAVRAVAGRLKSFGIFSGYYRPSFVIELYGLLSKCDTLTIEPGDPGTILFPATTQLPSLRTLFVYGLTPDHLESLQAFVLGRKAPLEVLQIERDTGSVELEEICGRVGTRLAEI